jgi:hypothetical protein
VEWGASHRMMGDSKGRTNGGRAIFKLILFSRG